jgi:hypothetical protein
LTISFTVSLYSIFIHSIPLPSIFFSSHKSVIVTDHYFLSEKTFWRICHVVD